VARNIARWFPGISNPQRGRAAMKIRGAYEAVILIPQSNDGTIGIAGGSFGAGIIHRVVFLDLLWLAR